MWLLEKKNYMIQEILICEGDAMNVILPLWNYSSPPHWSIEHLIEEARIILHSFSGWFVNHTW